MKQDLTPYKVRIQEYIDKKGILINKNNNPPTFQCPEHDDKNPSCVIYLDNAWCPVCQKSFDIFELAGIYNNLSKFPDKIKEVESVLNIISDVKYESKKKKSTKVKIVPFTEEKAKIIITKKYLLKLAEKSNWGNKINGLWLYKNQDNLIEVVDVRFEGEEKKKIISFYYTGEFIKATGAPVVLYGRENLPLDINKDKPVLITEGAKCANIAKQLDQFISMTWNGGSAKVNKADWSILKDKEVYILPDDDHNKYKT